MLPGYHFTRLIPDLVKKDTIQHFPFIPYLTIVKRFDSNKPILQRVSRGNTGSMNTFFEIELCIKHYPIIHHVTRLINRRTKLKILIMDESIINYWQTHCPLMKGIKLLTMESWCFVSSFGELHLKYYTRCPNRFWFLSVTMILIDINTSSYAGWASISHCPCGRYLRVKLY